jgi:hypothetical membrane protein
MINQRTTLAGALLLFAGTSFWLVNTAAEALFPNFIVRVHTLSRLGSPLAPTGLLWNGMVVVVSLLWLSGAALYFGVSGRRTWLIPNLLPGIGLLLLACFPVGSQPVWVHTLAAYWIFISSGLTALAGIVFIHSPYRYVSAALGTAILMLLFRANAIIPALGLGGAERLVAYPIFIWLISFGGFLMGQKE